MRLKVARLQGDELLVKLLKEMQDFLQCNKLGKFKHKTRLGTPCKHRLYCESWRKIHSELIRFLSDPRHHYSHLIYILEREQQKFAHWRHYLYRKKLQALINLLVQGAEFSSPKH